MGGASILHMGVTFYGRRTLRCFKGSADPGEVEFSFVPGSVYLWTGTGAEHQVRHQPPRGPREVHLGHSVTCMLRTTLFPYERSRTMRGVPNPPELFYALASSFMGSLRDECWRLPTLEECTGAMDVED